MAETTERREVTSIQCFPGGASFEWYGDVEGPPEQRGLRRGPYDREPEFRPGTEEEWATIRHNRRAGWYAERDVLCCDSSLVDDLLKLEGEIVTSRGNGGASAELARAFGTDEIRNIYDPDASDPSDWTLEQCKDYHVEHGIGTPEPDPWTMERAELVELLTDVSIDTKDDEPIETLREAVISNMDDETISGIDEWREAVREHASENPAEVFEWWRVSGWLCRQLDAIGEVTIDNGYGCWWGRCTTGQGYLMDGVLQRVAANFDRQNSPDNL